MERKVETPSSGVVIQGSEPKDRRNVDLKICASPIWVSLNKCQDTFHY